MKKLVLGLVLALIAVSTVLFVKVKNTKKNTGITPRVKTSQSFLPTDISLNGILMDDQTINCADSIVSHFIDDHSSSDPKTAIWFSITWVNMMAKYLPGEGADGFRIYFAKKSDANQNLRNAIVIVPTHADAVADPKAETGADHEDYFDHSNATFYSFLKGLSGSSDITEDLGGNDIGATLFRPAAENICPNDACKISPDPKDYISCQDAHAAVSNFVKRPNQAINSDSEWFPIDLITDLQAELQAALDQNPKIPADGIRIYFAKNIENKKDPKHKNRNCLIFATTVDNGTITGSKSHKDYYECYYTAEKGLDDHGEECPNNCNDITLPQ